MKYTVATLRAAGLEARWSRNSAGAPIIVCRDPRGTHKHQRETWWVVDAKMWALAGKVGLREAADRIALLGDLFSMPA